MSSPAQQRTSTGLLLAACAALLFASKGLFVKLLSASGVDYMTMATVRGLLALPLFAGLALSRGIRLRHAPPAALAGAALAGALGYGVGALTDFRALETIDVSVERALLFTYPALIVAWQAFAYRRLPRPSTVLALALTYGGIVLVVGAFDATLWRQNLMGAVLVLICAACMACYFLLGERHIRQLGSNGFAVVALTAAAAFVLMCFLFSRPVSAITTLTAHEWLLLVLLAVLGMFVPTLCQAGAIRHIGAERGALASTIGPPAALLLGVALLGERPGIWQLAGTGLILAGIALIARTGANPPR